MTANHLISLTCDVCGNIFFGDRASVKEVRRDAKKIGWTLRHHGNQDVCPTCTKQGATMAEPDPQPSTESSTEPNYSDRGFANFDPIVGWQQTSIRVIESSNAESANVALSARQPQDLNDPGRDEWVTAFVELDLDQIRQLRDQLDWMLANHYHYGRRGADK